MTDFVAPGPGRWELDRSHYEGGMTPISAELMCHATRSAYRDLFAELGVPADTMDMQTVHGFTYTRIRPLVGADRAASNPPPGWMVKALTRLHPEFRRRTRRAEQTLEDSGWDEVSAEWRRSIRPRITNENLAFQRVDLATIDDEELAGHLSAVMAHVRATFTEHHRLHGYDLGPIGLFALRGAEWGIDTADLLAALAGASPSTVQPLAKLRAIRRRVEDDGGSLDSLESIRNSSEAAAQLLDEYLELHGHLLFSSYDIDSPTLIERPDVVLRSIRAAGEGSDLTEASRAVGLDLRERVPVEERTEFDDLLLDARSAMDMRDDNGPITVEWPAGLLRLGLLEAGRRLTGRGRIDEADHVFELSIDEVVPLVAEGSGPSANELAERAAARARQRRLDPPRTLGPEEPPPDLDLLPEAPARLIRIVNAVTEQLLTTAAPNPDGLLTGTGIGTVSFVGVARTAESADEAIAELEAGEILVTRTTSPAYNLILGMAGALVTETGGAMSHAAVLSRELGLPAVIGAGGCLDRIRTGDRIEVDPAAGVVRFVE